MELIDLDFEGADLYRSNLTKVRLAAVKLGEVTLDSVDCRDSSIEECSLRDGQVVGARFSGTEFKGVDFRGSLIKDTALISVIGLNEMLFVAKQAIATSSSSGSARLVQRSNPKLADNVQADSATINGPSTTLITDDIPRNVRLTATCFHLLMP